MDKTKLTVKEGDLIREGGGPPVKAPNRAILKDESHGLNLQFFKENLVNSDIVWEELQKKVILWI